VNPFLSNNKKPSYKFEPKSICLSNNNTSNNKRGTESIYRHKSNLSNFFGNETKVMRLFIDSAKNANIHKLIFSSLNMKERLILKNFNKSMRKVYFDHEITKINSKLIEKQKEENPLFALEIPRTIERTIQTKQLILSNYYEEYLSNKSFKNLIDVIHLVIFSNESGRFVYNDNNIQILSKIKNIEKENINFYNIFSLFYKNLKTKTEVYYCLKAFYERNKYLFDIKDLKEDFLPLIELFRIIGKIFKQGQNMLVMIDIEILKNKLDIMSVYLAHIN